MVTTVLAFLSLSLLFYVVFGGADFGAGMLELFMRGPRYARCREVLTHAIGPVWEANHVWVILVVVVLFNGFPLVFERISVHFHIPLTLMLVGIVLRGCAFTFRHYDPFKDKTQRFYTMLFTLGSFLAPFCQGLVAGGLLHAQPIERSFASQFLFTWLNPLSLSIGVFLCMLSMFIASTFLVGESDDEECRSLFATLAGRCRLLLVVSGGLVFVAASSGAHPLTGAFVASRVSLLAAVLTLGALAALHWLTVLRNPFPARIMAGAVAAMVLLGWWSLQFPFVFGLPGSPGVIDLYQSAAPPAVMWQLLVALIVGSALIFPSLLFLMRTFKATGTQR